MYDVIIIGAGPARNNSKFVYSEEVILKLQLYIMISQVQRKQKKQKTIMDLKTEQMAKAYIIQELIKLRIQAQK